ncbi:MAG TPA: 30S ribosomal protein S2 [Candidatus Limnocylindrales bacterium]|nr:30S ribosomal protein S2 [Candidatus Limnocylindrales bacterium]
MRNVTLEELLEAGCHFGHQVSRQNPKASEYIFETRDGIHIIDLEKTKEGLEEAGKFVRDLAKKGGTILVLGTKRQAETILKEELKRIDQDSMKGLYFVTKRWIGGTLTNFSEVAKNFKKLTDISYRLQDENEKASYTKKEISDWDKSRIKLESFYGGIADMTRVPDALFIIDTHQERAAAEEALKMGTPTVGITDTNSDPLIINYPIPANDDAVGSLKLVISYIFDSWIEGKKAYKVAADQAEAAASKEAEAEAKKAKAAEKPQADFFGINEEKKESKAEDKKAEKPDEKVIDKKSDEKPKKAAVKKEKVEKKATKKVSK